MKIKIVFFFSMEKGGGKVMGNGVVVLGYEHLIRIPKTEAFKMIGQRSNLCQLHSPRTSFNSRTV